MSHRNIALMTKGHPFDRNAFFELFDGLPHVGYTHIEQPAAQLLFAPEHARDYDAFVLYDMPGIAFHPDRAPDFAQPPASFKRNFGTLLESGFGMVFLHHAIAGWPAWEDYARTIGGRFSYMPGSLNGVPVPDSGYRHSVTHQVRKLADHAVTAGVPDTFEITDELYLYDVLEDTV
ncbi:MAG: ThuA domain-containing protein, partial [Pseudomonadales bacterium]